MDSVAFWLGPVAAVAVAPVALVVVGLSSIRHAKHALWLTLGLTAVLSIAWFSFWATFTMEPEDGRLLSAEQLELVNDASLYVSAGLVAALLLLTVRVFVYGADGWLREASDLR